MPKQQHLKALTKASVSPPTPLAGYAVTCFGPTLSYKLAAEWASGTTSVDFGEYTPVWIMKAFSNRPTTRITIT
jgi:hypothetical protein